MKVSIHEFEIPSLRNEVALAGSNMSDGTQSNDPVTVGVAIGIAVGIFLL
ncbi:hypothetical protein [Dyella monticola]|nr:hypothetical protein [Dyella monticola]